MFTNFETLFSSSIDFIVNIRMQELNVRFFLTKHFQKFTVVKKIFFP